MEKKSNDVFYIGYKTKKKKSEKTGKKPPKTWISKSALR